MLKKITKNNVKKLFTIKGFKFLLKKLYFITYLLGLFMVLLIGVFLIFKGYIGSMISFFSKIILILLSMISILDKVNEGNNLSLFVESKNVYMK